MPFFVLKFPFLRGLGGALFLAAIALVPLHLARAEAPAQEALSRDFPVVFRDMGVVQNKAMNKRQKFLFAPAFALDFSDGPYSAYSVGVRLGYAFSDFWEIYALVNPKFINQKRSFVATLEEQVAAQNLSVDLSGAIAKSEYGVQVLWAPLYGKDSLGVSRILRSDTFLRFGASQIQYDLGTGLKFGLGVGKTFFLSRFLGLRALVEEGITQTIYQSVQKFSPITYVETGLVFYL